jgi:competence transcription factor ComK
MVKEDILYIYQDGKETMAVTKEGRKTLGTHLEEFLSPYCLEYLTTLKGRIDAIKIKYRIRKNVPLFIDETLNLFPTSDLKDSNNIYLNAYNIKRVYDFQKGTKVEFKSGQELTISQPYSKVYRHYRRAMDISL